MKPLFLLFSCGIAWAQLLPDRLVRDVLSEISSENAFEHTRALAGRVRYPNSASFFEAAEYVAARAREHGLQNVRIERFESKRPTWDPLEGDLDLVEPEARRLSSLLDTSVLIAQGSKAGDVTAEVVDVGDGTGESDYRGKVVEGKIVLASGGPAMVWQAMAGRGALGLISAAGATFFDRPTSQDAVLWSSTPPGTLTMMISPRQAEELRGMLRARKTLKVRMRVKTRESEPGAIGMVMGEIPGVVEGQDVVLVAHLDHQKPGANDNASGSGTLLEVLAAFQRLRAAGKIPAPKRTLRFWWSTEISSEQEYFHKHPKQARQMLLGLNFDQAGGDRNAENNFVVILGPSWLPTYADDLVYDLAESMKDTYAPAEHEPSPLFVAPNGGRQSFRTVYWPYAALSDHVSFEAKNVGVPCITMSVPSLHVIHTNQDTVDRIDPTWLKRSAALMLLPALFAANAGPPNRDAGKLLDVVYRRALGRLVEAENAQAQLTREEKRLDSVRAFDETLKTEPYKEKLRTLAATLSAN